MTIPCTPKVAKMIAASLGEISPALAAQFSVEEIAKRISISEARVLDELGVTSGDKFDSAVNDGVLQSLKDDIQRMQVQAAQDLQTIDRSIKFVKEVYPDDPALGLKVLMVGDMEARQSSRMSVALAQKEAIMRFHGELMGALKKAELWEDWQHQSPEYQLAVRQAAFFIDLKNDVKLAELPEVAVKTARVLMGLSESRRGEANLYGAQIDKLLGRITRQSHEIYNIRRAKGVVDGEKWPRFNYGQAVDEQAWVQFVMPILDHKATFPASVKTDAAKAQWLAKVWGEFNDGFVGHYTDRDPKATTRRGISPAKSIEEERVLHFTAEGAFDYSKKFGKGTLKDEVIAELDLMGNRIGLMSTVGLDPFSNMASIVKGVRNATNSGTKEMRKLDKYAGNFANGNFTSPMGRQYQYVTGATNHVVSDVGALLGVTIRTFEYVTKLGFATLSSVADVANMATDLSIQGNGGFLESMARAVNAPIEGMAKGAKRDFAEANGHGLDGMLGAAFDRMGDIGSPEGKMSKLLNVYFKWNALGPWTDASRRGLYLANTNYMAKIMRSEVLTDRYALLLNNYGISRADFNLVRKNTKALKMDGSEYFNTQDIRSIDLKHFTNEKARLELEKKFRSFFIDRNDMGVLTPDASINAMVHAGMGKGEFWRETRELFFQFKQFPIAMLSMLMKRNLIGLGSGRDIKKIAMNTNGEFMTMASHIVMLTGFGVIATILKDIAKGKVPLIPENAEETRIVLLRAMSSSGAMGLYGDFLMGEVRSADEAVMRLGGPAFNDVIDGVGVGRSMYRDAFENDEYSGETGSKMWKSIRNNIPFANTFHTKVLLDYSMLYWFAETMSPGFLDRQEQGIKFNRLGRGSIVPPREVVPYGGYGAMLSGG